jgi:histidinol-phosphate phosphatase family protein
VKPAVFLDRDGTLIEDVHYLDRLEHVAFYPWAMDALRLLRRAGFALVVVTNQSGIARGLFTDAFVRDTHAYMSEELGRGGVTIDGYFFCPHAAGNADCACRKPRPGLIRDAAEALGLDLARSVVVGDRWSDVALGAAVGAPGILVRTGVGRREERHPRAGVRADAVVDTLLHATTWILQHRR